MKQIILLKYSENTRKVEEEEKQRFIYYILSNIGLNIEDIFDENSQIIDRVKLRNILEAYGIQILDEYDGSMKIFVKSEDGVFLAGTFHKPIYKLKRDYSEVNKHNQMYVEMIIEIESNFESE